MALRDWDSRLISPESCLRLVGDVDVFFTAERADLAQFAPEGGGPVLPDQLQINMRCAACGQSITMLAAEQDVTAPAIQGGETTIGDLMSDVLRHQVTAHDQSLSGGKAHG
jgi:hypothetical protein